MAVTRTSTGALFSSAASGTVTFGAGAAAGNLGILIVETANQAITTPIGWTLQKGGAGTGTGTAGAAGGSMLSIYTKNSITSGDISGGIAISDSGDHQNAVLLTYSGVDTNGRGIGAPVGGSALKIITPASTAASTLGVGSAGSILVGDIVLAIIATDRDSATLSTNATPSWSNIAGSNSFPENLSSASGAGGGIIVNELVPSGSSTGVASFSCSITSSIMITCALQIFAPASGTTYNDTLSESGAADAALGGAETFANPEAETAAAAESLNPAGSTFAMPLAESSAAAATPAATQTFVNAASENTTPSDSYAAGNVIAGSLNEAAAAAAAMATAVTFASSQAENVAPADALANQVTFGSNLGESAGAAEALGVGLVVPVSASESIAPSDTVASSQSFANALVESAAAGDSVSAGATTYNETVNENLAPLTSLGVGLTMPSAAAEQAAAADQVAASAVLWPAFAELAPAADQAEASADFAPVVIDESVAPDATSAAQVARPLRPLDPWFRVAARRLPSARTAVRPLLPALAAALSLPPARARATARPRRSRVGSLGPARAQAEVF